MIATRARSSIFLNLVLTFLMIFPKGGVKIGGVPLTWGYLLLFLGAAFFALRPSFTILRAHLHVFLALIPFQLVSALYLVLFGIENKGFGVAFLMHFFVFPLMFFMLFSKVIAEIPFSKIALFLKKGMFFLAIYGLCLFVFVPIFGFFFSVPFLTINLGDMGLLETTKCIDRGGLFKLISTYNNGNLYGICMLMLMPLYLLIENSTFKRQIVKLSLVLTLSRTVWVGLIFLELFFLFRACRSNFQSLIKSALQLLSIATLIMLLLTTLGKDFSFLLDPTLGGRLSELSNLEALYDREHAPFQGISEMVYSSIYSNFGVLGLITFVLGITSPILVSYLPPQPLLSEDKIKKAALAGLLIYLTLSISDGAILHIPVMAFYWFLSAFLVTQQKSIA